MLPHFVTPEKALFMAIAPPANQWRRMPHQHKLTLALTQTRDSNLTQNV
jgi:hypothetical protein